LRQKLETTAAKTSNHEGKSKPCHPERSEGPAFGGVKQVLRFAQDDNNNGVPAFHFSISLHMRVGGSGTTPSGTLAFKNSTAHCGRTVKLSTADGTTPASPFAKVTGSRP
jgi:hypothetical protein